MRPPNKSANLQVKSCGSARIGIPPSCDSLCPRNTQGRKHSQEVCFRPPVYWSDLLIRPASRQANLLCFVDLDDQAVLNNELDHAKADALNRVLDGRDWDRLVSACSGI